MKEASASMFSHLPPLVVCPEGSNLRPKQLTPNPSMIPVPFTKAGAHRQSDPPVLAVNKGPTEPGLIAA